MLETVLSETIFSLSLNFDWCEVYPIFLSLFWGIFLALFVTRTFPVLSAFSLLSQGFWGFGMEKNPCFVGWFSLLFPKMGGALKEQRNGRAGKRSSKS